MGSGAERWVRMEDRGSPLRAGDTVQVKALWKGGQELRFLSRELDFLRLSEDTEWPCSWAAASRDEGVSWSRRSLSPGSAVRSKGFRMPTGWSHADPLGPQAAPEAPSWLGGSRRPVMQYANRDSGALGATKVFKSTPHLQQGAPSLTPPQEPSLEMS